MGIDNSFVLIVKWRDMHDASFGGIICDYE